MTAIALPNISDWPNMTEVDAYTEAYAAWEREAVRLSDFIAKVTIYTRTLENGPPFGPPEDWFAVTEIQVLTASATMAWNDMIIKYQSIPAGKKAYVSRPPTKLGHRQTVDD